MKSAHFGAVFCGVLSFLACATAPKETNEPVMQPASSESVPPSTEYGCSTENGEPRECSANEDCCSGYVCSLDPDRSRIKRYCLN
jgi:hypothetical protein